MAAEPASFGSPWTLIMNRISTLFRWTRCQGIQVDSVPRSTVSGSLRALLRLASRPFVYTLPLTLEASTQCSCRSQSPQPPGE